MMSTVLSHGSELNVGVRLVFVPVKCTLMLKVWPCARGRVSAVMSKNGSNLFGLENWIVPGSTLNRLPLMNTSPLSMSMWPVRLGRSSVPR